MFLIDYIIALHRFKKSNIVTQFTAFI